jgi:hypothetical protein
MGPVQILVVGFTGNTFSRDVLPELRRLRQRSVVRLIGLRFVTKDDAGNLTTMEVSHLTPAESAEFGEIVAGLIGFGAVGEEAISVGAGAGVGGTTGSRRDGETWAVSDAIPPETSAAVALIEHLWAIPLREAIIQAGGFALEDTWIHPADLAAAGAGMPRPLRSSHVP